MRDEKADELIREDVPPGGAWVDLDAGTGTFSRPLGRLPGSGGAVHAVDLEERAARALRRLDLPGGATQHVLRGDFTGPLDLPDRLDGPGAEMRLRG